MKNSKPIDVAIIGGGPAGLSAAIRLKKAGVDNVVVFERESQAGGAPRHCGHPAFGIIEHKWIETGPKYARRLIGEADKLGVDIRGRSSIMRIEPGCKLRVAHPDGPQDFEAKRVIVATGTREKPRSARLVSGGRANGICTTGTLQSMFYMEGIVPFKRPVVVGTELVAYSALLTCKKAGIRPVAMIEKGRPKLAWPLYNLCRLFDLELTTGVQEIRINEKDGKVISLQIDLDAGYGEELECDGVLFTGGFRPESSLVRASHLAFDSDTGSPVRDAYGRCSDPGYYAAGNIIAPAKMAATCWASGRKIADNILLDLAGKLPAIVSGSTFKES